jgi:hypothetical protein
MKSPKKTKVKSESTLDSFIETSIEVKPKNTRKKKEQIIQEANAKKNANKSASDNNILTGETFLKGFSKKKNYDEMDMNPNQDLLNLGFEFTPLPSGKCNIGHSDKFILNGVVTMSKFQGKWIRTIDSDIKNVKSKIKTLDFA